MVDIDNGGGSRVVLRDGGGDQWLHASSALTVTPGHEDCVTRRCFLPTTDGSDSYDPDRATRTKDPLERTKPANRPQQSRSLL